MSDRFHPLSMEQLTDWAFTELERRGSVFGVPRASVFVPRPDHPFRRREYGVELETPWGVAAGPQTQMAQNIVTAWLAGARLIELKTIQTLDELEVNKPCIDVTDEGYNVEWSQELKIHQSFDEYLRAWVLVHALHRALGFPGERPGVIFNMSVGYDLAGVQRPNVTWYLDAMADASAWLPAYVEIVARHFPAVRDIDIPARISDTVTLSTMHGCPPDEIERISRYLIEERGLHTSVKCNPTLLGAERVRGIVNDELGWTDVPIPDEAFGHDLRYEDAVPMFGRLRAAADERGLVFGLKLSNTLEVKNWRSVFERDATMYLSGRALHAVTVNLAATLSDEFAGELPLSFAGGADAFNMAHLLAGGLRTVTVCSDLLKTGGYLRLLQYPEKVEAAFERRRSARHRRVRPAHGRGRGAGQRLPGGGGARQPAPLRRCGPARPALPEGDASGPIAPRRSASLGHVRLHRAPLPGRVPVDQAVPRYMAAVRSGDLAEAVRVTRLDNPLPAILGRVCDHLCESTCIRTHLDEPLAIRHIKRFITEQEAVVAAATAAADRSQAATGSDGPRDAWPSSGPARPASPRPSGWRGPACTSRSSRSTPTPAAWSAGPSPPTGCRRPASTRTWRCWSALAWRSATASVPVSTSRSRSCAARAMRPSWSRSAPSAASGWDFPERMPPGSWTAWTSCAASARVVRRPSARGSASSVPVTRPWTAHVRPGASARPPCRSSTAARWTRCRPTARRSTSCTRKTIEVLELARPVGLRVVDGRLTGLTCLRTEYGGARDAAGRKAPQDVPGSEFEVGLDTLILAISQAPVLDLFGDPPPRLTPQGFLATDPETLQTSVAGVYAAGDVAAHGPASIVRAAADGKRAARAIATSLGVGTNAPAASSPYRVDPDLDIHALTVRRAHREYRVPVRMSGPDQRAGFEETVLGYTADEAAREASRCLDCDVLCSLCVGVCPNLALVTYETAPSRWQLPAVEVRGGTVHVDSAPRATGRFAVEQRFQVAVLTDLCNECGTCVTACPTAGRPYVDKPRLYLDREDFEAQEGNAFMLRDNDHVEGRFDGATHHLEVGHGADEGRLVYDAPGLRVVLDRATLRVLEAMTDGVAADGTRSLEPAVTMATLLAGIAGSLPHLPMADSADGGTRVPAPALA